MSKDQFEAKPDRQCVRCPAGHVSRKWRKTQVKIGAETFETRQFYFPAKICSVCAFRHRCLRTPKVRGRILTLHPFKELLRAARREQQTEGFRERYRRRLVVEHQTARLIQLGMRQAQYFGREKVLLQALLTAMVVNLSLASGL